MKCFQRQPNLALQQLDQEQQQRKQAIQLANYLNIEVVGYLRGKKAIVYTSKNRVINDVSDTYMGAQPNLLVLS